MIEPGDGVICGNTGGDAIGGGSAICSDSAGARLMVATENQSNPSLGYQEAIK